MDHLHRYLPGLLIALNLLGCGGSSPAAESSAAESVAAESMPQSSPETKKESSGLGEFVDFPASGVRVKQPKGFEVASSYDGFEQTQTGSSVLIMTMKAPFAELSQGFTQEQMAKRGWTLLDRKDLKVGEQAGTLIHFEQPAQGLVYLKWSVMFGDDSSSTVTTAMFPKDLEKEYSNLLKATVLSARLTGQPPDPLSRLPFTLTGSTKLRATPGAVGQSLSFTRDGTLPTKSAADPLLIVAPALGEVEAGDKGQLAQQLLQSLANVTGLKVQSTESITIDGLSGYESIAQGKDEKTGIPLTVYQVTIFPEGSYVRIVGLVGRNLAGEFLPEFKALARSLKYKPAR
jgi:hypothetical protein